MLLIIGVRIIRFEAEYSRVSCLRSLMTSWKGRGVNDNDNGVATSAFNVLTLSPHSWEALNAYRTTSVLAEWRKTCCDRQRDIYVQRNSKKRFLRPSKPTEFFNRPNIFSVRTACMLTVSFPTSSTRPCSQYLVLF